MSAQMFRTAGGHVLDRDTVVDLARRAGVTHQELTERRPRILKDSKYERHIERVDGQVVRMLILQDTKYGALLESLPDGLHRSRLANLATGMEIPDDEPVMIFRAQDGLSVPALNEYVLTVTSKGDSTNPMTVETAAARLEAFQRFQREHPDRVKLPS